MPLTINADVTSTTFSQAAPNCQKARGENSGSAIEVELATITLAASTVYTTVGFSGCATTTSLFQVVHDNDGTEDILEDFIVGPGDYTHSGELCFKFTSGVGTQRLLLKALNLDTTSCLRGSITVEAA